MAWLGHEMMRLPMLPRWGGPLSRRRAAVAISNAETRERQRLMNLFEEAYNRCLTAPNDGLSFSPDDLLAAMANYDFTSQIGSKVKGTVFMTDVYGAYVDITAKSGALLPVEEASLYSLRQVEEAGFVPGVREEFVIVGQLEDDDRLVLSFKSIQQHLAWERCRQLHAEDVTLKGKVVDGNKGSIVVTVEGLSGFVPFSQISAQRANVQELIGKEIPVKFVEVDEVQSRLVLSNRKAMADSQSQLAIGSVVIGTVQSLKPYGAFIDIGGINGLLHVSQVSHDLVADISTVLQPGDTLKVMILSHDRERGRVSLSTKKLEPAPGDMIKNPTLVFEKAEEMAQAFKQRIAQAEAMAHADMLRLQSERGLTVTRDGILDSLGSNLPGEGLNLSDVLPDID